MKIKFRLAYLAMCYCMIHSQILLANQLDPEFTTRRRILLSMDTLFRPALNSEGFLLIKSSELEILKDQIQAQFNFLEAEVKLTSKFKVDSIQQAPTALGENNGGGISSVQNQEKGFDLLYFVLIGLFLITSSILVFVYYRNVKKVKESQTRLAELENEFSTYKSTMVDRERKLMRELIDARNPEE
jgi:hypothetical protein